VLLGGAACSPKHPGYIDDLPAPTGTGGKSSTSDGGAGSTGNEGNQGGDGTTGPADGGETSVTLPIGDLTVMDPDRIYIFGTLAEGAGDYAICTVANPNLYMVGFRSFPDDRNLEILNGQLLYKEYGGGAGLRTFGPDLVSSLKRIDLKYPEEPTRNDELLVTPPCLAEDGGPQAFFTSPDSRLIYECPDEIWYEDGNPVFDTKDTFGDLIAMGYDGWTLLDSFPLAIMNVKDGQKYTIDGLDASINIIAKRATVDGFHIVLTSKTGDDTPELWNISTDAVAERVGIYPLPPVGRNPLGWGELTTSDELFEIGSGPETFQDIVVRRTLDGDSSVVYDEATEPRVKLHGSALFTGP
jgi:hypothetical protein